MRYLLLALALLLAATAAWAGSAAPVGAEIQLDVGDGIPQVGVFSDGGFVMVWSAGPPPFGRTVLHARLFDRDGNGRGGEFLLVSQPGSQSMGSLAVDADDTFLVIWADDFNSKPAAVYASRFSRAGRPIGSTVRLNTSTTLSLSATAIAVDPRGGFAAAWSASVPSPTQPGPSSTDAYARRFDRHGRPLGPELLVEQGCPSPADCSCGDAFVTALGVAPDGTLDTLLDVVNNCSATVRLRRYAPDGTQLVTAGNLRNCGLDGTFAMAADGSLVVACADDFPVNPISDAPFTTISSVRYSADGSRLAWAGVSRDDQDGVQPRVVTLPNGGYAIFWSNILPASGPLEAVYVQSFGADGGVRNRALRLNPSTLGKGQLVWSAAANQAGDVVVVWSRLTNGPTFARRLKFVEPVP